MDVAVREFSEDCSSLHTALRLFNDLGSRQQIGVLQEAAGGPQFNINISIRPEQSHRHRGSSQTDSSIIFA